MVVLFRYLARRTLQGLLALLVGLLSAHSSRSGNRGQSGNLSLADVQ